MNMLRPLSPHLKSSLRHLIISFIILSPLMFSSYLFFYLTGLNPDLMILKLKSSFILHGLRVIFRLFGLEIPIFILLSIVGSVVGSSLHMQDPAAGQPAPNPAAEQVSSGWTSILESNSGESSEERVEPDSGASSSGRSNSNRSVNQPQPGEQAMPPARPVVQEAANQGPPYPHDEMIGGDSIERIQRRLLSQSDFPSAHEIELARIRAEDLFEVKVDIIRRMTSLDPEGDWMRQGARALDNPRTSTGEESLERLYRLRDDIAQGGIRSQSFLDLKGRVFLRRQNWDAESQA